MKRASAVVLAIMFSSFAFSSAQQTDAGKDKSPSSVFENGTLMYLELAKTVDAKKAKPGDDIQGTLLADVVSHGKIVARRDAKLLGHVTEAQPSSKENPESRLGIVFDKVLVKGGDPIPINAVVLALRPAPRPTFDVPSAPAPPGTNPAADPPQERHYPIPKASTPKMNTTMGRASADRSQDLNDMRPTDIEGLSLTPSADGSSRVVVSIKHTVKLESGIRLELRITEPGAAK